MVLGAQRLPSAAPATLVGTFTELRVSLMIEMSYPAFTR